MTTPDSPGPRAGAAVPPQGPPAATQRSPHPLTPEVLKLATTAQRLAAEAGQPDAAQAIHAEAVRAGADEALVVVVGEKKRGKSTLINALLGRAELLPTAADIATGVHIDVGFAPQPHATVHRLPTGGAVPAASPAPPPPTGYGLPTTPPPSTAAPSPLGRSHPIRLDQVAEYAAVEPGTRQLRHRDVSHLTIGVPAPLLRGGLCLVDTPGVGGLAAGHTAITLATLNRADALVFVVNGQSELTASELAFLSEATQRIATVLFVLAQTDKFGSWREVLMANHALIQQHAPRYEHAPWFPVSARHQLLAGEAAAAGRDDIAAKRRERAGMGPLAQALNGIARRADALRLENAVHISRLTVHHLIGEQERRLRALTLDPSLGSEVRRAQEAIDALRGKDASWRADVNDQVRNLKTRCRRQLDRRVADLRDEYEQKITNGGADILDQVAADLPAQVQGMWLDVETLCRDELQGIVTRLTGEIGALGVDPAAFVPATPERLGRLPTAVRTEQRQGGFERAVMGISAGAGVRAIGSLLLGPVGGLIVGGLAAVLITVKRGSSQSAQAARVDARKYTQAVFRHVETEVSGAVEEAVEQARSTLLKATESALTARRAALQRTLDDQRRVERSAREDVERQRAAEKQRLDSLHALRDAATRLSGQLRGGGRPRSAPAGAGTATGAPDGQAHDMGRAPAQPW